ncbi:MAG: fused MFS/spermidine synthase [Desulfomonile tiedjei]|nr:fused MFS/spermidine synthase [Desulfomonile tiedjei]
MNEEQARGWRYTPHVIVFFSSAFIMVVEIVAGRLVARHLGNSLYTWTSIIGVILAGMSTGNYIGGRLADRWRPEGLLGFLFLVASIMCLSVLPMNHVFPAWDYFEELTWPTRTFLTVFGIFLLPAVALGTISPPAAKMAVERGDTVGQSIGSVYAWGAVGSIAGTLATGFWLVASLGSRGVVLSVSFALAVMAVLLGPKRWLPAIWAAILGALLVFSQLPPYAGWKAEEVVEKLGLRENVEGLVAKDSNYQFINVHETRSDTDSSRHILSLRLDYLIHGYVDLNDPSHLEYKYERLYRDVVRRFFSDRKTVSAFFIGGGSYTFPRWVLFEWPGSVVDVAEIDPMVVDVNYGVLGLPTNSPIRTFPADARNVVDSLAAEARYDLIVGDAFNDLSVPFHLTTLEFNQKVARHLAPKGLYMVNLIDDWEFARLLGSYFLTLKKTFRHVNVFCTELEGVKEGRETFVLAASMEPLQVDDWQPGHGSGFPGSAFTEKQIAKLARKSQGRILIDDNAPVENLLEPVVRRRQ